MHIAAFLLLSVVAVSLKSSLVVIVVVLVLWSFAAWSSGPTQQYNLIRIEPRYSGVMLGLNQSMMQLSMAAGAGIGGLAVDRVSLSSITWFGTIGVAIAVVASIFLFSWIRQEARKESMPQEHALSD